MKPSDSRPADSPDSLLTLAGPAEAELKEKRSRFIARAWPVRDEADATERIRETARHFHDARHVCHGWRLGIEPKVVENRNDDGEPGGTAGEPILAAVRRLHLVDVVVVVVRYFGGVKLGTGGLQRAYGGAADLALAGAVVHPVLLGKEYQLSFGYPLQKTLRRQLTLTEGRIRNEQYGEAVDWRVWVPHSRAVAFIDGVRELTADQVKPVLVSPQTRLS